MAPEFVSDLDDPRLAEYRNVPDPPLLRQRGVFVAEGRLVVRALIGNPRFRIRSILVSEAALTGLRDALEVARETLTIYVASRTLMSSVIGFNVHRGCLAVCERPAPAMLNDVLPAGTAGGLVVVLEGVTNADNIGGIFRNAAAFGADAVILSPGCCDPLYRKAVRVSVGATVAVPFASSGSWPDDLARLRERGFVLLALVPGPGAVDIDQRNAPWTQRSRIALMAGTEGTGLTRAVTEAADWRVRIPMVSGADSLNVATAVGIALHRLSDRVRRLQG